MKIYIEVVLILIIVSIFVFWKLWAYLSQKRLQKKYNPDNDKSRKGGIANHGELRTTEQGIVLEPSNNVGPEQPERRELLQKESINDVREDSNSTRKNTPSISRFFRKKRTNK